MLRRGGEVGVTMYRRMTAAVQVGKSRVVTEIQGWADGSRRTDDGRNCRRTKKTRGHARTSVSQVIFGVGPVDGHDVRQLECTPECSACDSDGQTRALQKRNGELIAEPV